MRVQRRLRPLLPLLLAFAFGCTKKEEEEAPPASESRESAEPSVPALDLWAGVPPIETEPSDAVGVLEPRPGPAKPPSVHETIERPLAPIEDGMPEAPPPDPPPLTVERHGPTGAQGLVDAIRLSFDQPMVPLADVSALKAKPIPLGIDPVVPGEVQWLGTRTLAFVPEAGRLPYSTDYTITVPAGVSSTWGVPLAEDFRWTISTPTLELESSTPWDRAEQIELTPTIDLRFNQAIERTALVAAMSLGGGGDRVGLELAPPPKDPPATAEPEWKAARHLQVRPERALRPNTRYTLTIPAGVYGEGPRRSKAITLRFTTYPPLTVAKAKCWGTCWADDGISLTTSTELSDPDLKAKVHVDPEPAGLTVDASWGSIHLGGDFEGRTRYRVKVDAGLRDVHGQTLARDFSTTVTLGPPRPAVSLTRGMDSPVVIEKAASKDLELLVAGVTQLELQARSMPVDELPTFLDAWVYGDDREWPEAHAGPTHTRRLATPEAMRHPTRIKLDLGPAVAKPGEHLWINLRSNEVKVYGWRQRYGTHMAVEITDLGAAIALDEDSGLVMISRLSTGEPVEGARVRLADRNLSRVVWSDTTDAEGLARFEATDAALLLVEHEGDSALLRLDRNDLQGNWRGYGYDTASDSPRAFIYTDRTPYKPGDTVHLAGILRLETRGPKGGVTTWRSDFTAEYQVHSPRGEEVAKGTVKVGPFGTFSVDIPTKEEQGTGDFQFQLTVGSLFGSDRHFYHSFPVETYRAPEFTVAVERPSSEPLVFGDELVAEVHGEYLHGAPLVGGQVEWVLRRSSAGFTPPGSLNEGFTFGIGPSGRPWGYGGYGRHGRYGPGWGWEPVDSGRVLKQGSGELDPRGVLRLEHALLAVEPPADPGTPPGAAPAPTPPKADEGPPPPATYTVEATVTDDNRQAIAGRGSFVVHAARAYVGLRSEQTVMRAGERGTFEAVLVDLEGERMVGKAVGLTLLRRETTRKAVERDGRWVFESETTEHEAGTCALESALVPAACELPLAEAGTYVLRGSAQDAEGHATRSELTLYVYGEDAVVWEDAERRVDLVPDRREYAPGDTATLLVRSPFEEARGVVVVEREGIAREIPITVRGGAATVEIPVDDTMLPSVGVSALLTRGRVEVPGAPSGQDLGMPAAATGQVRLPVSTKSKEIAITLEPDAKELSPGQTMTLSLRTTGADGEALPAAVAVVVVDEGVLSLMGHQTPDPLTFFHHDRADQVWLYALHAAVAARELPPPVAATTTETSTATGEGTIGLGNTGLIGHGGGEGSGSGYGRGSGGGFGDEMDDRAASPAEPMADLAEERKAEAPMKAKPKLASRRARGPGAPATGAPLLDPSQAMAQAVSLREVFATTAFFDAEITTDAKGEATVEIPMPENLTTFRVMAVAIDPAQADRFGHGDTTVRVRKPLMLRPSLPRFANFGDRFEASVMVDNQTGRDQAVMVGTRGTNVRLPGETETMVQIPAGESREVRFDMEVLAVGTMRLQFAALSNGGRDATELSLPVHYPATAEAFADYGMIDTATQRTVEPPADALPAFGGLELSMSSTALSGLEDAVDYLVTYPYECAEQTASRVLPIFALGDVLADFPVAGLRDQVRRERIAREGIERLLSKQNWDGGFGYWERGESWPYLSNWVTLALLEGKRAGFTVDPKALDRALRYVEDFVTHGHRTRWGVYHDWTSRALGLWILSGEKRGAALFDRVWAHRKEMPLYARALLMGAAQRYGRSSARDAVLDELRDAAVVSPRAVHFAESRSEAEADGLRVLMHSSVQTDAIALVALLEAAPSDPMLPKVMAGIMSSRDPKRGGRWGTTHANAWALIAADRYYETVEGEEPDFTARVWIDGQLHGEQAFAGRSMTTVEQHMPMAALQGAASRSLVLGKDGPGKLYYRMGLRYAPTDLALPAEDQGFVVYREYEALPSGDAEADAAAVQRLEDGGWVVKAGTNVKVTMTIVARDRARYVVVDDALPAGFEGQNPRFLTSVQARDEASRSVDSSESYGWWWPWWSFDHTDLRDDRMLLFADDMPAGVYTYSYTARATTLGTFQLPPIKAEAMYEPERFGHSASSMVRVVE
ncbi:MAG: Ig-like domain-containing protein [Myxococcales bacterium]|nr:Ig-like domain-containing protein [Myxococcales bacterium]